jgi:hypothetical protein
MLAALGWFAVRRRRWVVAGTLLGVVAAGALGGGVFGRLSGGGFSDPDAESSRAWDQLERVFGAGDPNLVLLVTAEQGSVDDPAVTAEGTALTEELVSEPSVQQASSHWTVGSALPLRTDDRRQALVLARIAGNQDQVDQAVQELLPRYTRTTGPVTVAVGGQAAVFRQISARLPPWWRRSGSITRRSRTVDAVGGSFTRRSQPLDATAAARENDKLPSDDTAAWRVAAPSPVRNRAGCGMSRPDPVRRPREPCEAARDAQREAVPQRCCGPMLAQQRGGRGFRSGSQPQPGQLPHQPPAADPKLGPHPLDRPPLLDAPCT